MSTDRLAWFPGYIAMVLGIGITIHISRLLFGTEWLLANYVTPSFDMVLAVLIGCGALCFWLVRDQVIFADRFEKVRYHVMAVYFTVSVPLHFMTYLTHSTDVLTEWFPAWFSVLIVGVQAGFLFSVLRLHFKPQPITVRGTILRLDALFLFVAGGAGLLLETVAHFFNVGPQRAVFGGQSWATIGFFEAHGLAVIIAVLLFNWSKNPSRGGHALATAVHVLLGTANVLFWPAMVVPLGQEAVVAFATGLHIVFALVQGSYALGGLTQRATSYDGVLSRAARSAR